MINHIKYNKIEKRLLFYVDMWYNINILDNICDKLFSSKILLKEGSFFYRRIKMRKKITILILAIVMLMVLSINTGAVEYANFVYNKKISLRVYESGQVDLIYKKKKYRFADESRCRFAGIDKNGAIYLLMINDCLYGFDYKKQRKISLVRLDEKVKSIQTTKYGYVKGYKKYNNKTYKLSNYKKKRLWKKALKIYNKK